MATRRFGSVRTLPSGRHQARWVGPDGKERHAPNTFTTKTAAREWLSSQETDLRRGGWVDPERGRSTFEVFARHWMGGRSDLRPRTRELYDSLLDRHILPELGPVELGRLDVTSVRAWHSRMLKSGTGQVTAAKAYRLLRTILNTAVEDSRIIANPCIIRGAGVERTPERPTASVEQVYALAGAIEPRYRVLVLLAAFSGLRFGELAALTRERIDLKAKTVTVLEAASDMNDGSRIIGPPKTDRGYRTVAVPPQVVTELRAHLKVFVKPEGDALVFAGSQGAPLRRGNFHRHWDAARTAAGVGALHFHDLRHTGNTLAAATGASTAELMARMGHASPRAALIYQHATADRDQAIAKALGGIISNRSRHAAGTTRKAEAVK